jgi:site-specific DNA-adenine methylase
MMRPFFSFFGSKYRVAPHYPAPTHPTIIEPFAGAAGYSLRYPSHQIHLYDADPTICGLWDYLINVTPEEIRRLPLIFSHIDDVDLCSEAKALIGFWLNKASVQPAKSPSKWMRDYQLRQPGVYWGERIRERIASQVNSIRHWTISQASYEDIPDQGPATWFIDPPYEIAGKAYKFHNLDYPALGHWCRSRRGQTIVCENEVAEWLPFRSFKSVKALEGRRGGKRSEEAIWTNDERPALPPTIVPNFRWQQSSQANALSL